MLLINALLKIQHIINNNRLAQIIFQILKKASSGSAIIIILSKNKNTYQTKIKNNFGHLY
ncbi:hypothetical protein CLOSPI_01890 [Thomasclavelia spiroformis DSM 1552]|uniref:Uncharacterized protein n=1 Tax=Thomasclavelia spiroformis DSM 1552 TaxID=428126 RepID=B1C3S2_9FIRM|nr:hypothetical protein CLOSPI_01890 [Thomasclavelia spiroformis DSM 1552]